MVMNVLLQTPQVKPVSPGKQIIFIKMKVLVKTLQWEDDNFPAVTSRGDLILEENEMMTPTLS